MRHSAIYFNEFLSFLFYTAIFLLLFFADYCPCTIFFFFFFFLEYFSLYTPVHKA